MSFWFDSFDGCWSRQWGFLSVVECLVLVFWCYIEYEIALYYWFCFTCLAVLQNACLWNDRMELSGSNFVFEIRRILFSQCSIDYMLEGVSKETQSPGQKTKIWSVYSINWHLLILRTKSFMYIVYLYGQGCHFPGDMKFLDFSRPRLSSTVIPRPFRGMLPQKSFKIRTFNLAENEFQTTKFPDFSWLFWQIPWLSEVSFKFPDFSRFSRLSRSVITLVEQKYVKFFNRKESFINESQMFSWHSNKLLIHNGGYPKN